jgi:hypothetical protein
MSFDPGAFDMSYTCDVAVGGRERQREGSIYRGWWELA